MSPSSASPDRLRPSPEKTEEREREKEDRGREKEDRGRESHLVEEKLKIDRAGNMLMVEDYIREILERRRINCCRQPAQGGGVNKNTGGLENDEGERRSEGGLSLLKEADSSCDVEERREGQEAKVEEEEAGKDPSSLLSETQSWMTWTVRETVEEEEEKEIEKEQTRKAFLEAVKIAAQQVE